MSLSPPPPTTPPSMTATIVQFLAGVNTNVMDKLWTVCDRDARVEGPTSAKGWSSMSILEFMHASAPSVVMTTGGDVEVLGETTRGIVGIVRAKASLGLWYRSDTELRFTCRASSQSSSGWVIRHILAMPTKEAFPVADAKDDECRRDPPRPRASAEGEVISDDAVSKPVALPIRAYTSPPTAPTGNKRVVRSWITREDGSPGGMLNARLLSRKLSRGVESIYFPDILPHLLLMPLPNAPVVSRKVAARLGARWKFKRPTLRPVSQWKNMKMQDITGNQTEGPDFDMSDVVNRFNELQREYEFSSEYTGSETMNKLLVCLNILVRRVGDAAQALAPSSASDDVDQEINELMRKMNLLMQQAVHAREIVQIVARVETYRSLGVENSNLGKRLESLRIILEAATAKIGQLRSRQRHLRSLAANQMEAWRTRAQARQGRARRTGDKGKGKGKAAVEDETEAALEASVKAELDEFPRKYSKIQQQCRILEQICRVATAKSLLIKFALDDPENEDGELESKQGGSLAGDSSGGGGDVSKPAVPPPPPVQGTPTLERSASRHVQGSAALEVDAMPGLHLPQRVWAPHFKYWQENYSTRMTFRQYCATTPYLDKRLFDRALQDTKALSAKGLDATWSKRLRFAADVAARNKHGVKYLYTKLERDPYRVGVRLDGDAAAALSQQDAAAPNSSSDSGNSTVAGDAGAVGRQGGPPGDLEEETAVLYGAAGTPLETAGMESNAGGPGVGICVFKSKWGLFVGSHKIDEFHHSSFLAGASVQFAGELCAEAGRVRFLSNKSGHYKPGVDCVYLFLDYLESQGVDLHDVPFNFVQGWPQELDAGLRITDDEMKELAATFKVVRHLMHEDRKRPGKFNLARSSHDVLQALRTRLLGEVVSESDGADGGRRMTQEEIRLSLEKKHQHARAISIPGFKIPPADDVDDDRCGGGRDQGAIGPEDLSGIRTAEEKEEDDGGGGGSRARGGENDHNKDQEFLDEVLLHVVGSQESLLTTTTTTAALAEEQPGPPPELALENSFGFADDPAGDGFGGGGGGEGGTPSEGS